MTWYWFLLIALGFIWLGCVAAILEKSIGKLLNQDVMTWHELPELPEPDVEVLAEVEGFKCAKYVVLKQDGHYWWQHIPAINKPPMTDGWVGLGEITTIKRWAYIEEE